MEKNIQTNRKQVIKKAAGIFLVVMLLLTFFSNTIMNYSLPEVATEPVMSGTVSNKVRGQGVVETNSDYEVMVSGPRVIKEVKVEAGDTVKKGQVLFTFEEGENSELTQAEETLDQMELDYAKSLLKLLPNYASDDLDVKAAKEDLEAAEKAMKEAKKNSQSLKTAKAEEDRLKKEVSEQQKKVNTLQEKLDAYGEVGDYDSAKAQVEALTEEVKLLKEQLAELQADLEAAGGNDSEIKSAIQDKELEIAGRESDLKRAKKTEETLRTTQASYTSLKEELKKENNTLTSLQEALTEQSTKVESLSTKISYEDAKAAVKEKRKSLTQMLLALKEKKEQDSLNQQADDMDMKAAQEKIEKQKQLVEKLKDSDDMKEVKSKEDGVVTQIDFKEGDSVTADTPIAKIQLSDSGYIVKISVTKAQAKMIKTGNEATVENVWDDGLSAVVKSIKADTENPNQNMVVTFEVKGDVQPGQTLSLAVGEKSNRYDAVVPNNAIREDSKGKFVLVIDVKGTPLGNRYKVRRADVEVMASDDTSSGVTGGVYEGENVATNATKPLEEGMQVRLVE